MAVSANVRFEIEDLYAAYAAVLDDGPLDDWPAFFTDPCNYQIVPRENDEAGLPLALMRCESRGMLMDRVKSIQELLMYEPRYLRHMISNFRIQPESTDDRVAVVANYVVFETLPTELTRVLNSGRYFDELVRDDAGRLKFAAKRCVYDSELVPNSIVYPL